MGRFFWKTPPPPPHPPVACVELYDRRCRAVQAIAQWFERDFEGGVLAVWVTVLRLRVSGVVFSVAVEADARFTVRQESLLQLTGDRVVILKTSGLLWVSRSSSRSPGSLTASVRLHLTQLVMQHMYEAVCSTAPRTDLPLTPELEVSPYAENGLSPAPVSFQLQTVLAWVVRRDPRLIVQCQARFQVNLPLQVIRDPSLFDFVLYLCTDNQCMLRYPRQSRRSVVLCGCYTSPAPVWHVVSAGPVWVLAADHSYAMLQLV